MSSAVIENQRAEFVTPPGQEALVALMFNPSGLSDTGWRLIRTAIERVTIHGFYQGPLGETARITLAHPSAAPPTWRRTKRFAIRLYGNSRGEPVGLLYRAVLASVGAAEAEFVWQELESHDGFVHNASWSAEPAPSTPTNILASRDEVADRERSAEPELDLHLDYQPFVDLQLEFDHAGALAEALALKNRFVIYQSDPRYNVQGWRSLALQALDGDPTHAATTDADEGICEDQSRYQLTDVAARCPIILSFLERVLDFAHCRTITFLMLEPGARIIPHVDGVGPPVMRSVNIALNMPAGCTLTIDCNPDGSAHPYTRHVPFRDGSVMLMNVAKHHCAVNDSALPRIHVVSRGAFRMPVTRVLKLAEEQDGLHGPDAVRAALAEKHRVLSSLGVSRP